MTEETKAIVPVAMRAGGAVNAIVPQTFEECWRIAQAVTLAGMAPATVDTPEKALIAIMHGLEVGLTPMAALQSIAVIGNRPTIWGDGAIGLIRGSGKLEWIREKIDGEGQQRTATCQIKRKGEEPSQVYSFSMAQAQLAGLAGKDIWKKYPDRMLQVRPRSWALRDTFADVLRGLGITEEVQDYGEAKDITPGAGGDPLNLGTSTTAAPSRSGPPAAPKPAAKPAASEDFPGDRKPNAQAAGIEYKPSVPFNIIEQAKAELAAVEDGDAQGFQNAWEPYKNAQSDVDEATWEALLDLGQKHFDRTSDRANFKPGAQADDDGGTTTDWDA